MTAWRSNPLPVEFDASVYRERNADLTHLDDNEIADHYKNHGRNEGRCASKIDGRTAFFSLIPTNVRTLEIGPFNNPAVRGPMVEYFDTLSTTDLQRRARSLGIDDVTVPEVRWVDPNGDLGTVSEKFDCCVSSHSIEHQPDLVAHLQVVQALLNEGGRYFLAVPDCRYTFDHFLAESTIAEVIDAHHARRSLHTLRSVIEHRALTTHNNPVDHWAGIHGEPEVNSERVRLAVEEFLSTEGYLDVHAWVFSPNSCSRIVKTLNELGLIDMKMERLFSTLRGSNEFYMVLETGESRPNSIR